MPKLALATVEPLIGPGIGSARNACPVSITFWMIRLADLDNVVFVVVSCFGGFDDQFVSVVVMQ